MISKIPEILIYKDKALLSQLAIKLNEIIDTINSQPEAFKNLCDHDYTFRCPKCENQDGQG